MVIVSYSRAGAGQLAEQRIHFEAAIQGAEHVDIERLARQVFRRERQCEIAADRRQLARQFEHFKTLAQAFADLARDVLCVRYDAVDAAVFVQPFRGGLRAHLWHAGNVVRAVADERKVIDDLLGQHVELRLDAGAIELGVEHCVDAGDAVVDELRHVLVARRDHDLEPIGRRAFGERADDVVGFDALDSEQRQAESWNRLDQRRDLGAQVVRHRRPMRLVFLEELVTESPPRRVEHDRDELRVLVLEELVQHVEHAKHGSGRHARLGREWRQGVERAVEVGRAVYQPELAGLAHRYQPPGGWVSFFFSSSSAGVAGARISTGVSMAASGRYSDPVWPHPVAMNMSARTRAILIAEL